MSEEPPAALPDIRVISVTMEPPDWRPKVEWGDDFDDYSVPTILKLAADSVYEQLLEAVLDGDEDDDE